MFFYDTCALLDNLETIFDDYPFAVSNVSLAELENIKTSTTKDEEIKYKARKLLHLLSENLDKFITQNYQEYFIYHNNMLCAYEATNDLKIISCAIELKKLYPDLIFVTNDLSCYMIAKNHITAQYQKDELKEEYTGCVVKRFDTDEALGEFYTTLNEPKDYLKNNQYLFITDSNDEIIDRYIYKNDQLIQLIFPCFNSKQFGRIKPKDAYQWAAMDSMMRNKLTLLRGPAGSGKSYLALGYLFEQLERGRIDKIIIFCNPVATKDACKFGFLPGTAQEKILGSQIGNFLISKIGAREEVERLIENEQLVLLPVADCRGYDATGMHAGIYVTEAQNTTIDMMKLMLQRIGEDSICIMEGDDCAQVDMSAYAGANNGVRRLSEVFRGDSCYGEVTLQKCYRSHIAELAENM